MQRRHDARRARRARRREHLHRQVRGRRVRHRVVRVDDVEPMRFGDTGDRVRQREQVLRFAEQRIRRHDDLLETDGRGFAVAPPERRFAADQVHLVAARGQRLRELRCDHAAAAHRCVADDARCSCRVFQQRRAHDRLANDDSFGKGDAGERAELRVAALDELPERRRRQARRDRRRFRWRELAIDSSRARRVCARKTPTRRRRTTASRRR